MPMCLVISELPGHSDCPAMALSRPVARDQALAGKIAAAVDGARMRAGVTRLSAAGHPGSHEAWAKTTQAPGIVAQY
jgi:hypothetical protein